MNKSSPYNSLRNQLYDPYENTLELEKQDGKDPQCVLKDFARQTGRKENLSTMSRRRKRIKSRNDFQFSNPLALISYLPVSHCINLSS